MIQRLPFLLNKVCRSAVVVRLIKGRANTKARGIHTNVRWPDVSKVYKNRSDKSRKLVISKRREYGKAKRKARFVCKSNRKKEIS